MQETWVPSLDREDALEKEMATLSSILFCEIPWTEEPGGHSPSGHKRVGHDLVTKQQAFKALVQILMTCILLDHVV